MNIEGSEWPLEDEDLQDVGEGGVEVGRWYLFPSTEAAGLAARAYWEDLERSNPTEFRAVVGDETLVQWALGRYAGPGFTQVNSLSEWLDLWLETPEEHWARYDWQEWEVQLTAEERCRLAEVSGEYDWLCTEDPVAYQWA